jgi:hypothetical protein
VSWSNSVRSDLKKVFSPDIGVDASVQVLAILAYVPQGSFLRGACGLTLGLALISNENPNFEMLRDSVRPEMVFWALSVEAGSAAAACRCTPHRNPSAGLDQNQKSSFLDRTRLSRIEQIAKARIVKQKKE